MMTIRKPKPLKTDQGEVEKPQDKSRARLALMPSALGAVAIDKLNKTMQLETTIGDLAEELEACIKVVQSGDMAQMEAMLVSQAQVLQTTFVSLLLAGQRQKYVKQYQILMSLALKAQAQSRATIQALVELRYPRQIVVANQANIANGPQQVNNGNPSCGHAEVNRIEQSKLLSETDYEALDGRGAQATGRVDQEVGAVETVFWSSNEGG